MNGLDQLLAQMPDESVRRHFLAPLAYRLGMARFRNDYAAAVLIAEYREQAVAEAIAVMGERGIPVILLKGVSYVGTIYDDPGERPMSDVDLMVQRHRRADAARALRNLGYWNAGGPISGGRNYHAVTFKRRNGAVDLHWTIVQPWRSSIDVAALWRRARPAAERSDGALRLDSIDEAALHLAHIARHELRVPLINYVDAQRLTAVSGVAPALERAAQFRLARAVRAAMAMTAALLQGEPFGLPVLPSPEQVIRGDLPGRPRQVAQKLALLEGPREWVGLGAAYMQNWLSRG